MSVELFVIRIFRAANNVSNFSDNFAKKPHACDSTQIQRKKPSPQGESRAKENRLQARRNTKNEFGCRTWAVSNDDRALRLIEVG